VSLETNKRIIEELTKALDSGARGYRSDGRRVVFPLSDLYLRVKEEVGDYQTFFLAIGELGLLHKPGEPLATLSASKAYLLGLPSEYFDKKRPG